jgi:hypothetical protein
MHTHTSRASSVQLPHSMACSAEDDLGSAASRDTHCTSHLGSIPSSRQAYSARGRAASASGFAFHSYPTAIAPPHNVSMSAGALPGLHWSTSNPLPEDATLQPQLPLPPFAAMQDPSGPSRSCTSADYSCTTCPSTRPSGSGMRTPVAGEVVSGPDEGDYSHGDGSISEGGTVNDPHVSSHAIPGLRREASLPRDVTSPTAAG